MRELEALEFGVERIGAWLRASALRRRVVLACTFLVYALGLLWPFAMQPPEWISNGARWTEQGSLLFPSPGLAVTRGVPELRAANSQTDHFALTLSARSLKPQQGGPARIITLSHDNYVPDLAVSQSGQDLLVQLRRQCRVALLIQRNCQIRIRIDGMFATLEPVSLELRITRDRLWLKAGERPAIERLLPQDALILECRPSSHARE